MNKGTLPSFAEKMRYMKKIIMTGATGFIGTHLRALLTGFEVKALHGKDVMTMKSSELAREMEGYDILINVAGRSIFTFWTKKAKQDMYDSRVELSRKLVKALAECKNRPRHFYSASTIGIYKGETWVTESEKKYASNFLADLVRDWEKEVKKAEKSGVKVTLMRFGIVLGKGSGAYNIMRNLTRLNLGGYFGEGRQSLSFVWIHDLVRAIRFILDNEIDGIVNITTGQVTDYKTVFNTLKKKLHASVLWPVPEFVPRLLLGEASIIYLEGQKVIPQVLMKNSFNFEASNITDCVNKLEAN